MAEEPLERLARALEKSEISGVALNAGPTLSYLTGLDFHLMERPVVYIFIPRKKPVLILPSLESAKIEGNDTLEPFFYEENPEGWADIFTAALNHLEISGSTIGVEPLQLRYLEYTLLNSAGELNLVDGSEIIGDLRSRKMDWEIERMQRAVDIAEKGLQATLPLIRFGMSEKEVASELVLQLFRHGSESTLPFEPIVAAGPNGANPHAKPSERMLQPGDLLIIDWGASFDGYVSDLTRTFAIGEVDDESRKIHELVQLANAAGRAAGGVGKRCGEVDIAAREVIENAGYGEFFTHRTGHGIGMQCHEEPYIRADNDQVMEIGMTYTVEPGIYLPGKNGVRIEDDVYLSKDGPISLSTLPRELTLVGS